MKNDRIILPPKLQTEAISLARKRSHPGVSQIGKTITVQFLFPQYAMKDHSLR